MAFVRWTWIHSMMWRASGAGILGRGRRHRTAVSRQSTTGGQSFGAVRAVGGAGGPRHDPTPGGAGKRAVARGRCRLQNALELKSKKLAHPILYRPCDRRAPYRSEERRVGK